MARVPRLGGDNQGNLLAIQAIMRGGEAQAAATSRGGRALGAGIMQAGQAQGLKKERAKTRIVRPSRRTVPRVGAWRRRGSTCS